MKLRALFVMPVLALALILFASPSSAAVSHNGTLFSQSTIPDNDGDGMADEFDMDDDNDGIIDIDDPEPLNPAVPDTNVPPAPQPGTSISDADGDGLSDDLDLDDDIDGVIDADDPDPFDPAVPGSAPPVNPDTGSPSTDVNNQPEESPSALRPEPVPVVTALPSTGSGSHTTSYLAVATVVFLFSAVSNITARRYARGAT